LAGAGRILLGAAALHDVVVFDRAELRIFAGVSVDEEISQEIRNTPVWVIMGPDPYDHNSQRQAIDAMREARDQTYALKIVREIEESRLHSLINLIYEALDIGFPEVTRDFVFRAKGQLHYPTSDWLFKKAYRNDEINAVSGLFDLAYSDSFNFILDEPIQVRSLIQIIIEGLLPSDILIELREQVQLDDQISRSLLALIDANI